MNFRAFTLVLAATIAVSSAGTAFGGLFDGERAGSGLNLEKGYDVNTVTVVSGKVTSIEATKGKPVTFEVRQGNERVRVVASPPAYWERNGIPVRPDDELVAKGSKAQGKDGRMYLLAGSITNTTLRKSVTLRSETGTPAWAGGTGYPGATGDMGGGRMGTSGMGGAAGMGMGRMHR